MAYPARLISVIGIAMILSLGMQTPAKAQTGAPQDAALRAVRSFYTFHLAHNATYGFESDFSLLSFMGCCLRS
jgi:hypothetical protein